GVLCPNVCRARCSLLMDYHPIIKAMQAGQVRRYHTAVDIPPQSVAEHTFNVMVIATYLVRMSSFDDGKRLDQGVPLQHALFHDLGEIYMADIPGPVKSYVSVKHLEAQEKIAVMDNFSIDLDGMPEIVKMADQLECLWYFARCYKLGCEPAERYYNLQRRSVTETFGFDVDVMALADAIDGWFHTDGCDLRLPFEEMRDKQESIYGEGEVGPGDAR
ncbi:MAG: HD domain-containing protein, partial [Gammaproteobacteria bacterium]|nr:HD domain-containing protein [Gammaproteobacteria bacterium]